MPFVGLDDIQSNSGELATAFCRKPETLLATKFRFSSEHVLYGKLRPYLNKVTIANFDGVCTTEVLPLRPIHGDLDRDYLLFMLLSPGFVTWASAQVSGANLPRLDPGRLVDFGFHLPSIADQRRVTGAIREVMRIRRVRSFALNTSEGLLDAVFLEMFPECSGSTAYSQCPARPLEQLADIASGITKGQKHENRRTVLARYLRVANVQDGRLDLDEIKSIRALPEDVASLALSPGDVLMTEGGDFDKLGRGAIWEGQVPGCIHQNHIFRVRLDRSEALPEFFASFLRSPLARSYFLRCAKQTTNLASINMTQLRATPVPNVAISRQERFARARLQISRTVRIHAEALRQADHLFKTLLHEAFGESHRGMRS